MINRKNEFYDLPGDGLMYVDGSATFYLDAEGLGSFVSNHKNQINLLSRFNQKIKHRVGGVLTVGPVLEEINHSLNYYRELFRKIKSLKKKRAEFYVQKAWTAREEGRILNRDEMDEMFHLTKKGAKEFRRFHAVLEEGMSVYGLSEDFDLTRQRKLVDKFNNYVLASGEKLSLPDKELVISALGSGSGNGIISADGSIIRTYSAGVKKFRLEECFVCDSRQRRSYFLG